MTSMPSRNRRPFFLSIAGLALAALTGAACGGGGPATDASDAHPDGSPGDTAPADMATTDTAATETGGEGGVCSAVGTGQLDVTIVGLPAGTVPMVRAMGGGLAIPKDLTPGTPISLNAGPSYKIGWRRVKVAPVAPAIIGKAFYLASSTFDGCVKAGVTTTATLTYMQEPGSEKMWITVSNPPTLGNVIAGFNGADLAASATKNPTVWKSKNFTGRGAAGAIDSAGNFWVPGGDRINGYAMMTLAAGTPATPSDAAPAVTLTQPAGASAKFAAFDASGNLWVSRGAPTTDNSVVRYDESQLATSGSPTPTVVLKSTDFMNPAGIAFDKDGDLWVANAGGETIVMILAANLAATRTAAADVVITAHTGTDAPVASSYSNPNGLAFDRNDDLWVGYISNLAKITKAQQAASASLAPVALNYSTGQGGIAFDESGGLWMAGGPGVGSGKFQRLPATELAKAVAMGAPPIPTPDIVIDSSAMLGDAESIVINPAPTWSVGLHDAF